MVHHDGRSERNGIGEDFLRTIGLGRLRAGCIAQVDRRGAAVARADALDFKHFPGGGGRHVAHCRRHCESSLAQPLVDDLKHAIAAFEIQTLVEPGITGATAFHD